MKAKGRTAAKGKPQKSSRSQAAKRSARKCPEGGEHEYTPDLEYDHTGNTINCEKCGEPPPNKEV